MASTFTHINTLTLTSTTTTISFTSIPDTYTDLVLKGSLRSTGTIGDPWIWASVAVNSVTGGRLDYLYKYGSGIENTGTTATELYEYSITSSDGVGYSATEWLFPNYSTTNQLKTGLVLGCSAGLNNYNQYYWNTTSAISSISYTLASSRNFETGSIFSLYGIKKA